MLDRTLRAPGYPTWREISRAVRGRALTTREISGTFPMTVATVSHHLALLRKTDLVRVERSVRHQIYSLEATVFQEFLQQMLHLLGRDEAR
jgi:ArsR family transcriptional regulator, arsenate/arsenite/antimonite-responsive transcriptional repressor